MITDTKQERYSFSKLTSFETCKYGYFLTYLEHKKGVGNCFSSYGLLIHKLMEQYAKGEIELWNLSDLYEWEFDTSITTPFPKTPFCPNMKDLYFRQGLQFLENFPGYTGKKILEVESAFNCCIDDWIFNGVIDLVYETPDGQLILQDYKSKKSFKNKKEQHDYARQLYLYSLFIKEKYNRYPDLLKFMMFRANKSIEIQFKQSDLNEAVEWAKKAVQNIRDCTNFNYKYEDFYCNNICNHRDECPYSLGGD